MDIWGGDIYLGTVSTVVNKAEPTDLGEVGVLVNIYRQRNTVDYTGLQVDTKVYICGVLLPHSGSDRNPARS